MAVVRSAALNQSGSTSITRTFSTHASPAGAPASGHLLISCLVTTALQSSVTPPTGWTVIESMPLSSTYLYASWAYKFCDGTDDTVTWSWGASSTATLVILEFDDAVTALDDSAEDESDINTAATTFDTGSATATVSTGLALAFFGIDSGRNVDGGRAYNNSFGELIASFAAAADRGGVFLASKAISGTGAYDCQFTTTDTGDRGYGSIALFGTPSSGVSGTLASTTDAATLAAAGKLTHRGTLAETTDAATLAAAGKRTHRGSLAQTTAPATLAAAGKVTHRGTLARTTDDATLAASGTVTGGALTGTLAVTLADATLVATGKITHRGTLAVTLDDCTLAASQASERFGLVVDAVSVAPALQLDALSIAAGLQAQASITPALRARIALN